MTVTVVAMVTINDDASEALAAYFRVAGPLLEKAGAKIVQRFEFSETIIGLEPAQSVIIVEYPSRDAVDQVFGSDEYQALKKTRDKAFSNYQISIVAP